MFYILLKIFSLILPLLIAIAYMTLAERKIMGAIQRRKGPDIVGIFGLLQPLADGLKLFIKETILPSSANSKIFILAPILTFLFALLSWCVIPFDEGFVFADLNIGVLYILAISSLGVYGIIIAGWSSNSKFAFLGALRSTAQMISYEVSIGLIIINVLLCTGSLNFSEIVLAQQHIWFIIPLFPVGLMFYISILAETNRAPFDLPEAEAELVAGYNVEYSAMGFALFFLGEYANMILMCGLTVIFFFGGWLPILPIAFLFWIPGSIWFGIKLTSLLFGFIWVRSSFPRYRYDQLMRLGWKIFLPLSLSYIFVISSTLLTFDWLI
uniref:NADH dehydrogenase subunit 1 n=1 Tax=Rhodomelopsis africana TaxID=1917047 RepID=UPI0022FD6595|nr:NADH dehydrogenase subunit 1 [Rhodomelopsis africana]WAX04077.1 NADH dehydrogenase subunit 1 [Rhodomelopsis africana]